MFACGVGKLNRKCQASNILFLPGQRPTHVFAQRQYRAHGVGERREERGAGAPHAARHPGHRAPYITQATAIQATEATLL